MKKFGLPPYYQTEAPVAKLKSIKGFGEQTLKVSGQSFHFVHSGEKDNPIILFIHGSPGAWTAWADYLADDDLRSKYYMIAVDRLGFAGSDNGMHEESLEEQAKVIMHSVIKHLATEQKLLVIGHSYGGPVALRLAVDYPQNVSAIGLLAPSISPELEQPLWYNKLAANSLIRKVIPTSVDRSNQEILPLKEQLNKMKSKLETLNAPAFIIQGQKDKLVPAGNADFGKRHLVNSKVEVHLLPERGHFIPWQEYELVKRMIFKYGS